MNRANGPIFLLEALKFFSQNISHYTMTTRSLGAISESPKARKHITVDHFVGGERGKGPNVAGINLSTKVE